MKSDIEAVPLARAEQPCPNNLGRDAIMPTSEGAFHGDHDDRQDLREGGPVASPVRGDPLERAQALTTEEIRRLVAACADDLVGLRDGARFFWWGSQITFGSQALRDRGAVGRSLFRRMGCHSCVTAAYRNSVPNGEIMDHSPHRGQTVMRSYVCRSKLSHASPAGKNRPLTLPPPTRSDLRRWPESTGMALVLGSCGQCRLGSSGRSSGEFSLLPARSCAFLCPLSKAYPPRG